MTCLLRLTIFEQGLFSDVLPLLLLSIYLFELYLIQINHSCQLFLHFPGFVLQILVLIEWQRSLNIIGSDVIL